MSATEEQALSYRKWAMGKYASSTASKYVLIVARLTAGLWRAGYLKTDPFALVRIPNQKGRRVRWYRELTIEEIRKVQVIIKSDEVDGLRNGIIFNLLFKHALRISEVLGARVEDYKGGVLKIRNPKEGEDFTVDLSPDVRKMIERLIQKLEYSKGFLLCSHRHGKIQPEVQLCPKGINAMLKRHAQRAGIKEFSSHSGRVTAITNLLRKGYTYEEVRTVSRHSANSVVERYDRRSFEKPIINYEG
jgi:integrase